LGAPGFRAKLLDGFAFFSDGPYRYCVFDSDVFRIDVVLRKTQIKWSDAVAKLPTFFKVVVNGNYFSGNLPGKALYAQALLSVVDPKDVNSAGNVLVGGSVALPDNASGKNYFFFGRDNSSPPVYDAGGPSNPTGGITDGMGGLGPLILTNPVTHKPMKFGDGNVYASNPAKTTPPTAPADFQDIVQRNNNTYASIHREAVKGTGFCAVAVIAASKLLVAIIKPDGTPGGIDALRDGLFASGANLACFTDGSDSACMAIDGVMESGLGPAGYKDDLIETGFGFFLFAPPPPAKLSVRFVEVKVLDDENFVGAGVWTLSAIVSGTALSLLSRNPVNTGDVIPLLASTTLTVGSGDSLSIQISGKDEGGVDDDLGTVTKTFGPADSPRFGVGTRTLETGDYRVTVEIKRLP
jgi:hypothetical protein